MHPGGPLIITAIHDGHWIRPELRSLISLTSRQRRREEDPYTGRLAAMGPSSIVVKRSRFEVDINRPREDAVYRTPAEAWGLKVWQTQLDSKIMSRSISLYDLFYNDLSNFLALIIKQYGQFLLLDLHSYNHRRGGPNELAADPEMNPEIDLGTETFNRATYGYILDAIKTALANPEPFGRTLDVRENVKFTEGELTRWIHRNFGNHGCAVSIEIKKTFMDEWTGRLHEDEFIKLTKLIGGLVKSLNSYI